MIGAWGRWWLTTAADDYVGVMVGSMLVTGSGTEGQIDLCYFACALCPLPAPSLSFSLPPCNVHSSLGLLASSLGQSVGCSVFARPPRFFGLDEHGSRVALRSGRGCAVILTLLCLPSCLCLPPHLSLPPPSHQLRFIVPTGALFIVSVPAVDSQANVSVPPWHASCLMRAAMLLVQ